MKSHALRLIVLVPLFGLTPVAADSPKKVTAEQILLEYLRAVQREIGSNPKALGYDGAIKRLHKLGEKHLLKNKAILHKKASGDYLKMDELKSIRIKSLKRIHWDSADNYTDGNAIKVPDAQTNKVGTLIVMFIDGGYGIPPYSRHTRATTWWNPLTGAKTLRNLALKTLLTKEEFQKRMIIEDLAAASIFRLNSDPEKPSIGFLDGKELLVIDLKYTDVGIYSMAGIRWVKLDDKKHANKSDAGDGK